MTWIDKDDPSRTVVFRNGEDPRKTKSVHAWFFKNGKCTNHYIIRSQYILDNYKIDK